jgi:hypothetical protein
VSPVLIAIGYSFRAEGSLQAVCRAGWAEKSRDRERLAAFQVIAIDSSPAPRDRDRIRHRE